MVYVYACGCVVCIYVYVCECVMCVYVCMGSGVCVWCVWFGYLCICVCGVYVACGMCVLCGMHKCMCIFGMCAVRM